MEVILEYLRKFGKEPLLLYTMSYEDEIYQTLMSDAIKRGTPLTSEEIEKAFKDAKYDIN